MRRISSLPTAERCPMVDKIGLSVETTNSARSTIFHAYCETGVWPADISSLDQNDIDEIKRWTVPIPFTYRRGDVSYLLQYQTAIKETRVALDWEFNDVDIDPACPQELIAERYPEVMTTGTLDMAWVIPDHDLVIVCDIKSSIWAVADKYDSLQLHGYGQGLATKLKIGRYVTAIWDAQDGEYFVRPEAVEMDGFEAEDIRARIKYASTDRDGGYRTGLHCRGCWKRAHCGAHLVDVPDEDFRAVISGNCSAAQVREALHKLGQREDLKKKVTDAAKDWVRQHGSLLSEDGKKEWRPSMRKGKPALDTDAIARTLGVKDLEAFKTRTSEYEAFDWRNRKDG